MSHDTPKRFIAALSVFALFAVTSSSAQAVTAATITTVTSSKNPTSCAQSVTFIIIVTLANGITRITDGTITFTLAPDPPLTSTIGSSGQSEFTINTSDPGHSSGLHAVTVTYNGTSTFNPSSASMTQTITGAAHDFDGNCKSDILWRNTNGGIAMWLMNGATVTSSLGIGSLTTDWTIVGQRDFDGDGFADILWRNSNGGVAMWLMNSGTITSSLGIGNVPTDWQIQGVNAD